MFRFSSLLAALILSCGFASFANATCNPPSKPGAVICYPSANSHFAGTPVIEAAATGESAIVKMILYVDNVKEYEADNVDKFTWQGYTGPIQYNGAHHFVLNAWDSGGHFYQYSEYATEEGGGVAQCAQPASGFNLCSPANHSYQPNSTPIFTTGAANIASYQVWLNGQSQFTYTGKNLESYAGIYPVTAKAIKLTVQATDTAGKIYTQNRTFKAYWVEPACGRSACGPGLLITSPTDYEDTTSPITIKAEVQNNPNPITAMKAYLDNTRVATSTGPTLYQSVAASPGTHVVTVEAWDTKGVLYLDRKTVNVE